MRRLSVTRHRNFVNSLLPMQVFTEDRTNGKDIISGVTCRYLGELANGTTAQFEIDDSEQMVFIIPANSIKKKSNEFYLIDEGTQDVQLSGKNYYNPLAGNPFRFDNNTNDEALRIRKKVGRNGILSFIISLILTMAIISGITFLSIPRDKVFSFDGFSITLTNQFDESTEYDGYLLSYESRDILVTTYKGEIALYPTLADYTIDEYAADLIAVYSEYNDPDPILKQEDGMSYVEYTYEVDNDIIYSRIYLFRTETAFWEVEFTTWQNELSEHLPDIEKYVASIRFE